MVDRRHEVPGHLIDAPPAIDRGEHPTRAVVVAHLAQRPELLSEPRPNRLDPVIVALDQGRPIDVAASREPGRMAGFVVDVAARLADPAARKAPNQLLSRDIDLEDDVD